jgi:light-regulated signal transduction histidine kinase (bacteriophytochrome)
MQTEDEVEHLRRELERTNAEFEEFVSMAAHNMRESLRDVSANSQLLVESYAGLLDFDASVLLERIQDGTTRMQTLLTDVVDYWTPSPVAPQFSSIDMESVLDGALLGLEKQINKRGATVTRDPLPPVRGNFEMMSKVLKHMIRNGIEFCDAPSPHVHISCRQEAPEWTFSVKDNGPGIASEFQCRLFGAFRRLHGKEHPGNGLGLAFCKKTIERFGGRMWLESAPGVGSTFYFTAAPVD